MQSSIPNRQFDTILQNPTEIRACARSVYSRTHARTRNSPKNAATVRRVHPPTSFPRRREATLTPIIPHSQTTPFPLPFRVISRTHSVIPPPRFPPSRE